MLTTVSSGGCFSIFKRQWVRVKQKMFFFCCFCFFLFFLQSCIRGQQAKIPPREVVANDIMLFIKNHALHLIRAPHSNWWSAVNILRNQCHPSPTLQAAAINPSSSGMPGLTKMVALCQTSSIHLPHRVWACIAQFWSEKQQWQLAAHTMLVHAQWGPFFWCARLNSLFLPFLIIFFKCTADCVMQRFSLLYCCFWSWSMKI